MVGFTSITSKGLWLLLGLAATEASAVSTLFEHGTVISFDDEALEPLVLRDTSLLVTDGSIAAIFPSSNNGSVSVPADTEVVDATNDILSPGFIDTHRHTWQTVLRTLGADAVLSSFFVLTGTASSLYTNDTMYWSNLMGFHDALASGVTTIVDNASGSVTDGLTRAAITAAIDSGARVFAGTPLGSGIGNFTLDDQFALYKEIAASQAIQDSLVELGLLFEGFESAPTTTIQAVSDFALSNNISFLQAHHSGGAHQGSNSPFTLNSLGFLNQSFPVIFVHATSIDLRDTQILREQGHYTSVAPEFELQHGLVSNSWKAIPERTSLSLGSNSFASPDLITQARIWMQVVRQQLISYPLSQLNRVPANTPLTVSQAFLSATRNGALALRRPDLGVLTVGAKADIAVFDGAADGVLGYTDPVAAVLLHSAVGHVKHVLVDGQWRKKNFTLECIIDCQEARTRFLDEATQLATVLADLDTSPGEDGEPSFSGAPLEAMEQLKLALA